MRVLTVLVVLFAVGAASTVGDGGAGAVLALLIVGGWTAWRRRETARVAATAQRDVAARIAGLEAQVAALRTDRDRWQALATRAGPTAGAASDAETSAAVDAADTAMPVAAMPVAFDPAPDPVRDGLAAFHPSLADRASDPSAALAAPGSGAAQAAPTDSNVETWRLRGPLDRPGVDLDDAVAGAVRRWFAGGNTVVRAGAVVLLAGVAFLLRYVVELVRLPMAVRLAGSAVLGAALLVTGARAVRTRRDTGLAWQAAGFGVLYLTAWGAHHTHVVPSTLVALVAMACVAVACATAALRQDAESLAVLGIVGGYATPVLLGGDAPTPVVLFMLLAIIGGSIAVLVRKRPWRVASAVGATATFVLAGGWIGEHPPPAAAVTVCGFLAGFAALWIVIPLLIARHDPDARRGAIAGVVVACGVPAAAWGLAVDYFAPWRYGPAWLAVFGGAVWALAASAARRIGAGRLADAWTVVAATFASAAVALVFDPAVTAAIWALAGAAAVAFGVRRASVTARFGGLALQAAAAFAWGADAIADTAHTVPVANTACVGALVLGIAGLASSFWLADRRNAAASTDPDASTPRGAAPWMLAWGAVWIVAAAWGDIHRFVPAAWQPAVNLALVTGLAPAFALLARALRWPQAATLAIAMPLPWLMLLGEVPTVDWRSGPPDDRLAAVIAHLGWAVAIAVHVTMLRQHAVRRDTFGRWMHAAWLPVGAFVAGSAAKDAVRAVAPLSMSWDFMSGAVPAVLALLAITARPVLARTPFSDRPDAYLRDTGAILGTELLLFALMSTLFDGKAPPLPWTAFTDPFAWMGIAIAVGLVRRDRAISARLPATAAWRASHPLLRFGWPVAVGVCCANATLVRGLCALTGTRYALDAVLASAPLQTTLSIVWTVVAIAAMTWGARRAQRGAWIGGATLLGAVVLKLVAVDLSNVGDLARVVSFIGVGALMLGVGWLVPLPPAAARDPGGAGGADPAPPAR